jgi:hypothetical protein
MPIELKSLDDLFKVHRQVEAQMRQQMQQLSAAPLDKQPAVVAAALDEPLARARAALAQAKAERDAGIKRLDERLDRAQQALAALEAQGKQLRSSTDQLMRDAAKAAQPGAGGVQVVTRGMKKTRSTGTRRAVTRPSTRKKS